MALREILEASSIPCTVLESENGLDAVKNFKEKNSDLILMDVQSQNKRNKSTTDNFTNG